MPQVTVYKLLDSGTESISVIPPPKRFQKLLTVSEKESEPSSSINRVKISIRKKTNIPSNLVDQEPKYERGLHSVLSDINNLNKPNGLKRSDDSENEKEELKKIGVGIPTSVLAAKGIKVGKPVVKAGANLIHLSFGYVLSHPRAAIEDIEQNTGIWGSVSGMFKKMQDCIMDIKRSHAINRSTIFYGAVDTTLKISGSPDRYWYSIPGKIVVSPEFRELGINQMYLDLTTRFKDIEYFQISMDTELREFGGVWNDPTTWVSDFAVTCVGIVITALDFIRIMTGLYKRLDSDVDDYKSVVNNSLFARMLQIGNWMLATTGALLQSGFLTAIGYSVLLDNLMYYITEYAMVGVAILIGEGAVFGIVAPVIIPAAVCLLVSVSLGQILIRMSTYFNDLIKKRATQDLSYQVPLEPRNFKNKCENIKHPYGIDTSLVRRVLQTPDFRKKYPIMSVFSPIAGNTLLSYSDSWNLFSEHSGLFFYLGKNPEKIAVRNNVSYVDFKGFSVRLSDIPETTRSDHLFFRESLIAVYTDESSPIITYDQRCKTLFESITNNNEKTPLLDFPEYYRLVALLGCSYPPVDGEHYFKQLPLWNHSNNKIMKKPPESRRAFKLRRSLVSVIRNILKNNIRPEKLESHILNDPNAPLSFVEVAPFNNPFVPFALTFSSEQKLKKNDVSRDLVDDNWGYLVDYLLRVFCDPRIKYTTRTEYAQEGADDTFDNSEISTIVNPPQVKITNVSDAVLKTELEKVKYQYYELVNIYLLNLHEVLRTIANEKLYHCDLTPRNLQTRYLPINETRKTTKVTRFIRSIEGVNETNRGEVKNHSLCAMPVYILPAVRSQFSVIDITKLNSNIVTEDFLEKNLLRLLLPHELPHIALLSLPGLTIEKLSKFILGVSIIDICLRTFYYTQLSPIQSISEISLLGEEYNWMKSDRGPSYVPTDYLQNIQNFSISDISNTIGIEKQKYSIYFKHLTPNSNTTGASIEEPKEFSISSEQLNDAFKKFKIDDDESLMKTVKNFAIYLSFFGSPIRWKYFKENSFIGCKIITHIIKRYSSLPENSAWTTALSTDPLPAEGIWKSEDSWCRPIVYKILSQPGISGNTMKRNLEDYLSYAGIVH